MYLVLELSLVREPVAHPGPVEAAVTPGHSPGLGGSVADTVVETRGANSEVPWDYCEDQIKQV